MSDFATRRRWGPTPKYPKVVDYIPPDFNFICIAGPCSVESEDQIKRLAEFVAKQGATHLRGGVFRAGTYPGENFGLVGDDLIEAFAHAGRSNGLKTIIEVLDYRPEAMHRIAPFADCYQVGARQMQNYTLLRELGATEKQIFLKRNPGATIDEWLGAAEHLLTGGPCQPVLIERGSGTNSGHVRWDLSISMIPAVGAISKIPVVCDPSHVTCRRYLVEPLALAGVAAGAAGLLIEVHPIPEESFSDADQAITPTDFKNLMRKVRRIRKSLSN